MAIEFDKKKAVDDWAELVTQGNEHFNKRRTVKAEDCFLKALALAEKLSGLEPIGKTAGSDAADSDEADSDSTDKESLDNTLKNNWRTARNEDQDRLSKSTNNLAALYHSQGKYSMAEDNYQRSLDIKLSLYGEDHLETAVNYHNLAMLYSAQRQYPRAEILYKRTLEVRENEYGKLHPELVPVLENYALMLKKANRPLEATSIETRLRNIKATS